MTLKILQCMTCEYGSSLKWSMTIEGDRYKCSEYPKSIPLSVENSFDDCPKYKEKSNV